MGKIFELDAAGIEHLLETSLIGRIACFAPGEERPYIVPIGFGYDGTAVYFLSGPGRKIEMMRRQPLVSFEVDHGTAEDRWQSVVAEGIYEELVETADCEHALRVMFANQKRPDVGSHMILFRILLTQKTGRFELPDDEAALWLKSSSA
ncbi:MAG: pyridoxamine 5'-phosphate oxidase family protein [Thermomicrobiales bacterium]